MCLRWPVRLWPMKLQAKIRRRTMDRPLFRRKRIIRRTSSGCRMYAAGGGRVSRRLDEEPELPQFDVDVDPGPEIQLGVTFPSEAGLDNGVDAIEQELDLRGGPRGVHVKDPRGDAPPVGRGPVDLDLVGSRES